MSSEKRLVLVMIATFITMLAIQYGMEVTGLTPPRPKPQPDFKKIGAAANDKAAKPKTEAGQKDEKKAPEEAKLAKKEKEGEEARPAKLAGPKVAIVEPDEIVLGSDRDKTPGGYRLKVSLEQQGAGVASVASSRYDAEFDPKRGGGRKQPRRPLQLLQYDPTAVPSLALALRPARSEPARPAAPADDPDAVPESRPASPAELPLAEVLWDVVRDDNGRIVKTLSKTDPATKRQVEGQEIAFRTTADELGITLTKKFRLWKGEDGFEMELELDSPQKENAVVCRLFGPHNIPIEGEWYTGTFRDVYFGQVRGKTIEVVTKPASDIAKPKAAVFDNTSYPLAFAGIENQYFTVFVEPSPIPQAQPERWDSETTATVVHPRPDAVQKSDISFEILSRTLSVGPNHPSSQTFKVYAGPKTTDALAPYRAGGLASYRKYQWFGIPGASWMAMHVIAPLLDVIYDLTAKVASLFGGRSGNYGVAIILLTLLVRLIMFPLGRKQAISAKRMQDLQPLLKEIQEKYKDDKERQTRETFALYKKHGVNPVGGCLPALIQLPIFVGLWQALNNSVHLRHAHFLYIQNLAAPDMLFRFPTELPLLGDYFNLLPFLVVSLMLVQTKLFAPPATTPEAEMQQKMMKYMMIFMAFMFYKVPSGLGLYFITSSLWQISERLLLPKVTHAAPTPGAADDDKNPPPGGGGGRGGPGPGGGGRGGPGGNGAPVKPQGKLAQFWEKVKAEAAKDSTYRKMVGEIQENKEREKDRGKGKPRARPGRKR
jgi:YidC/Oxa1 family membrane protein insertase